MPVYSRVYLFDLHMTFSLLCVEMPKRIYYKFKFNFGFFLVKKN